MFSVFFAREGVFHVIGFAFVGVVELAGVADEGRVLDDGDHALGLVAVEWRPRRWVECTVFDLISDPLK